VKTRDAGTLPRRETGGRSQMLHDRVILGHMRNGVWKNAPREVRDILRGDGFTFSASQRIARGVLGGGIIFAESMGYSSRRALAGVAAHGLAHIYIARDNISVRTDDVEREADRVDCG